MRENTAQQMRWNVRTIATDGGVGLYPLGATKAQAREVARRQLDDDATIEAAVVVDSYEELPDDRGYRRRYDDSIEEFDASEVVYTMQEVARWSGVPVMQKAAKLP